MSGAAIASDAAATPLAVRRVGASLGGEISGVDLSQPIAPAAFAAIDAALVEHEVIVFRDQDITAERQKAFGRL